MGAISFQNGLKFASQNDVHFKSKDEKHFYFTQLYFVSRYGKLMFQFLRLQYILFTNNGPFKHDV